MKKMLISVFVLACNFIFAQFGIDQKLVEIEPFLSQSNAYPGSTVKLAVKLSIADTWHINSDKPNDEFLIPSELLVESENEITVDNITYPEAKNITLSFSEQPVSVFEGEEYIYANIIIPAATDKDTLSFKVVFHYQACNNESCMPPSSVETDVSIKIADLSEGINVTHGKIFAAVTA
ncbi:MAG: thiol:disulfide interchange protein, partial [Melioribacteraceae bacterium]|nr:thiol:disulfide interchange protein [Melioribacteraceae bacterium]